MVSPTENPYVGPRTFEEKDARFFFGREREARDLLWLVMSEPLVLFYAPSGAGKSSLINTRLVPGLRREGFQVLPIGRVSGELPAGISEVGNIFVFNLLLSLDSGREAAERLTHVSLSDYLSQRSAYGQAHEAEASARSSSADGYPLGRDADYGQPARVLIVDQFEEILTAHLDRWQERKDFFRQLRQAFSRDPLLWAVLTIREDFVAALDPYARLLPGRLRARFYMQRMGHQAALEAVGKPAEQSGRPFAQGVAETLVDNLRQIRVHGQARPHPGEFVEPVQLQVACYQLWENLKGRPPADITYQDLRELGDVDVALAQFYEGAMARVVRETGESEIELRSWFEHQLITEAGTRGTVYQGPEKTGGMANRTVELLANQYLLRAEIRAGGTWYELVHDRFIEPILQANQAWGTRQSDLVRAALAWDASERVEDNLYRGQQLKVALASIKGQTPEPLVAEFLAASEKLNQALEEKETLRQRELEQAQALAEAERRRAEEQARSSRRLRRLAVGLAIVFLVAVIAALVAVGAASLARSQGQLAQEQRQIAQDRAQEAELAQQAAVAEAKARATAQAQSEARRVEAETARADAEAAQSEAERSALVARAGQLAAQAQTAIVETSPQRGLLLAVEAVSITLQSSDLRVPAAESVLWQALGGAGGLGLGSHDDTVRALAFSPDKQWLVTGGGRTARLWKLSDLAAGPTSLAVQGSPIAAAAISPDSQYVTLAGGTIAQVWDLAELSADPLILRGHQDPITALAFSPDSRWLLTGSEDATARVWDLTHPTSEPVILLAQETPIQTIAVSPNTLQGTGKRWLVTTGGFDDAARVWDVAALPLLAGAGELNAGLSDLAPAPIVLRSGGHPIAAVAISPDISHDAPARTGGRWLAVGADDTYLWYLSALFSPDSTMRDAASTPIVLPSQSFVNALAFSPDKRWLVTGNQDGSAHAWDVSALPPLGGTEGLSTGLEVAPVVLRGHQGAITRLAISPDGRWLATGGVDRTARLWDLANLDVEPVILRGHDDMISSLAISPGGRWLATGSADRSARLWDLDAPDPAAATPIVLPGHEGWGVSKVAISPGTPQGTGQHWLVAANEDATLRLWDLATADASTAKPPAALPVIQSGHEGLLTALAISPGGRWLATGGEDAIARVWDLDSAPDLAGPTLVLTGHQAAIRAIAFTSDSTRLVSGGDDAAARLWDLTAPGPVVAPLVLPGQQGSINAMAMTSDDHWLATAGGDGSVCLWNVSALPALSGAEGLNTGLAAPDPDVGPIVLRGHERPVASLAISPDDRWLASGDDGGGVCLWDLGSVGDSAVEPIHLPGHTARITALAVSADEHWLVTASADRSARLWDLTAVDPAAAPIVLTGHERGILALAVSPDSRWLITASFDSSARLWDLTAADPAVTAVVLRGHERGIFSAAIGPNASQGTLAQAGGHWLVTGSADGTARLWTLWPDELLDLACRTAGRNLTPAEWAAYFSGQAYRETCTKLPAYLPVIEDEMEGGCNDE